MSWSPDTIRNLQDENEVRAELTEWAERSGAEVYWGECPTEYSQSTFSVNTQSGLGAFTGSGESDDDQYRPDMLLVFDNDCLVVEVKSGHKYSTTMDGAWETFDYWRKYEQDRPEYRVGGETYQPDSFVFATRCSPFGHLFPDTDEFLYKNEYGPLNQTLPMFEGNMTGLLIRMIWRFARELEEPSVEIGVLLSSVLEDLNGQEEELDDHNMMRATELEGIGTPAIFSRIGGTQDWKVL